VFFKSKEAECVLYINCRGKTASLDLEKKIFFCLFSYRNTFCLFSYGEHIYYLKPTKSACCLYIYIYRTHSTENTQNTFHREQILIADALLGLIQLYTEHILSRQHSIENTFHRGLMLPEKCPVLQQPLCGCAPWPMHTHTQKKNYQHQSPSVYFVQSQCTNSRKSGLY